MIRTQMRFDEREYELMKFAGVVGTGNLRSSQTVDDIVYGQKD